MSMAVRVATGPTPIDSHLANGLIQVSQAEFHGEILDITRYDTYWEMLTTITLQRTYLGHYMHPSLAMSIRMLPRSANRLKCVFLSQRNR